VTDIVLKNKPLVEAIFELRWILQNRGGTEIDPEYKLLIGRISERIQKDYPDHESLPTATMPDEFAAYVVQHQFRTHDQIWPLVQLGPGIVTLNETQGYVWSDFRRRIDELIAALYLAYPNPENSLKFRQLLVRYIDAVDFDFDREDIFSFLSSHLKTTAVLHQKLFEDTQVQKSPAVLDLTFSFPCGRPTGAATLRLARGVHGGKSCLLWETHVHAVAPDVPSDQEAIMKWVDAAHDLTHDWFFKMIDGPLYERFK
jgi:uncharacterized protein (TIGR04255 family)